MVAWLTLGLQVFFFLRLRRANRYPLSPNIFRDFRIVVKRIGACGGQSLRTLKGTGVTALPEKICEKTILIILFVWNFTPRKQL